MPSKITNLAAYDVVIPGVGRIAPGTSVAIPTDEYDLQSAVRTMQTYGVIRIESITYLSPQDTHDEQQAAAQAGPDGINIVLGDGSVEISGNVFHGAGGGGAINVAPGAPNASAGATMPPVPQQAMPSPEPEPELKPPGRKGPKPDRWDIE